MFRRLPVQTQLQVNPVDDPEERFARGAGPGGDCVRRLGVDISRLQVLFHFLPVVVLLPRHDVGCRVEGGVWGGECSLSATHGRSRVSIDPLLSTMRSDGANRVFTDQGEIAGTNRTALLGVRPGASKMRCILLLPYNRLYGGRRHYAWIFLDMHDSVE